MSVTIADRHDLLTRLRAHAMHRGLDETLYGESDGALYAEAADEIERLRAALREEASLDCGCPCCGQHVGIATDAMPELED